MIYDAGAEKANTSFVIDDVFFAYFNGETIIHRFIGKEE